MARDMSRMFVVDVEATCWAPDEVPSASGSEIIEIGLCELDLRTLERSNKRSYLVCPRNSQVSAFCTQLTTITPDMLVDQPFFGGVVERIRADMGKHARDAAWGSWGDYDLKILRKEYDDSGMHWSGWPLGRTYVNLKYEFARMLGLPRELSMPEALKHAGIDLEGTHHRGGDDAWNIAEIAAWLTRRSRGGAQ